MSRMNASHSLRLNLCLLSVVAMWPVRHGPAYSVLGYVSYILALSAFVFWFGELGTVLRVRYDAKQLLGYVGLLCGHFVSLYKWFALVVNRRELERLVDSLNNCLQTGAASERSAELHRFNKAANRRATIMTVCWMVGAMYVTLYWSITPLLHNGSLVELPSLDANETFKRFYFLPFGEWPFLNTSSSPAYELLYTVWATGSVTHGWMHASCDCFYLHVIIIICSHFEFLIATVSLVEQYSELAVCIRYHEQLLSAARDLNTIFSSVMFMQLFNTLFALCTFAFDVSTIKPGRGDSGLSSKVGFFAATIFQLYIYCTAGSRLAELSGRVADAGYDTHWIENVYWRRPLGLLIMRAQKTLKLTGGPFYVISYETLLAHLQLSFSYFTVLKNMNEPEN